MNASNVNAGAIARLIIALLLSLNTILGMAGINPIPISDDLIYTVVSGIATILSLVWTWWKDNDITEKARKRKALGEAALEASDEGD